MIPMLYEMRGKNVDDMSREELVENLKLAIQMNTAVSEAKRFTERLKDHRPIQAP